MGIKPSLNSCLPLSGHSISLLLLEIWLSPKAAVPNQTLMRLNAHTAVRLSASQAMRLPTAV